MANILDTNDSFCHAYQTKKPKNQYKFHSIYDAYQKYAWNFKCVDENNKTIEGYTLAESTKALNNVKHLLAESIERNDYEMCQSACLQVLKWGGVLNKNQDIIFQLDTDIIAYMTNARTILAHIETIDERKLSTLHMGSGFSKIYALLLDDFVIYDSRVGAALCFLIRKYCEENKISQVPTVLQFSWALARGKSCPIVYNPRNPGNSKYHFPVFTTNKTRHFSDNIKANWLLQLILDSTSSQFSDLPKAEQLRALESALFMIGYQVNFATD